MGNNDYLQIINKVTSDNETYANLDYNECEKHFQCANSFCSVNGTCAECSECEYCTDGIDGSCGECEYTSDGTLCQEPTRSYPSSLCVQGEISNSDDLNGEYEFYLFD